MSHSNNEHSLLIIRDNSNYKFHLLHLQKTISANSTLMCNWGHQFPVLTKHMCQHKNILITRRSKLHFQVKEHTYENATQLKQLEIL